jgi:hypothetical protein
MAERNTSTTGLKSLMHAGDVVALHAEGECAGGWLQGHLAISLQGVIVCHAFSSATSMDPPSTSDTFYSW